MINVKEGYKHFTFRPKNVTEISNCQLVGKTSKVTITEDLRDLPDSNLQDPTLSWHKAL